MFEPDVALVACELETGRTHQIRVHLQATGHSVVGDPQYGGARMPLVIGRPFLHAGRLVFAHPLTGEPLEFTSVLPADLDAFREELAQRIETFLASRTDAGAFIDAAAASAAATE